MASQLLLVVENRHAEVWRLRPKLGRALRESPMWSAVLAVSVFLCPLWARCGLCSVCSCSRLLWPLAAGLSVLSGPLVVSGMPVGVN